MKKSFKNILLIHSSNDLYGASKVLIEIIEVLIKSGHSIHLILPENGPLNDHELMKNVKFIFRLKKKDISILHQSIQLKFGCEK